MALLIDGHNLIGAGVFSDISLADEDDEAKLVARLKVWRSRYRGTITVVFDRGIPGGHDRTLSGSGVEVIFAATPVEADDLIQRRLRRRPKNLELVSNDAKLVSVAASYGVPTLSGSEFVERFTFCESAGEQEEPGEESDVKLSDEEVDDWMKYFAARPKRKPPKPPTLRFRKRRR